ncbi:hypothetical protein MP228_009128 [Amoeboaphelidium protococcarum]|nr:hypothetical protein MP228_009128 [Amoeboaphelidium protococcarum]
MGNDNQENTNNVSNTVQVSSQIISQLNSSNVRKRHSMPAHVPHKAAKLPASSKTVSGQEDELSFIEEISDKPKEVSIKSGSLLGHPVIIDGLKWKSLTSMADSSPQNKRGDVSTPLRQIVSPDASLAAAGVDVSNDDVEYDDGEVIVNLHNHARTPAGSQCVGHSSVLKSSLVATELQESSSTELINEHGIDSANIEKSRDDLGSRPEIIEQEAKSSTLEFDSNTLYTIPEEWYLESVNDEEDTFKLNQSQKRAVLMRMSSAGLLIPVTPYGKASVQSKTPLGEAITMSSIKNWDMLPNMVASPGSVPKYSQKDIEKVRTDLSQDYESKLSAKNDEIQSLKQELADSTQTKGQLKDTLDTLESLKLNLEDDIQRQNDRHKLIVDQMAQEKKTTVMEFDIVQKSFQNLRIQFEEQRVQLEKLKKNEDQMKLKQSELQQELVAALNAVEAVKSHAEGKMNEANMELERIKQDFESEKIVLLTQLNRAEAQVGSLQKELDQAVCEKQQLSLICNEFITKLKSFDTSSNNS